jgi:hypothetical protein
VLNYLFKLVIKLVIFDSFQILRFRSMEQTTFYVALKLNYMLLACYVIHLFSFYVIKSKVLNSARGCGHVKDFVISTVTDILLWIADVAV